MNMDENLGQRIVEAARYAVRLHLAQSVVFHGDIRRQGRAGGAGRGASAIADSACARPGMAAYLPLTDEPLPIGDCDQRSLPLAERGAG